MAMKTIRIDDKNFFWNEDTNSKTSTFNPEENIKFIYTMEDGSILRVDKDSIVSSDTSQYYFDYNNNRYYIDDGFQNILVRSGYISYGDYDEIKITDKSYGQILRKSLMNLIKMVIDQLAEDYSITANKNFVVNDVIEDSDNRIISYISGSNYNFIFTVETINSLVSKNQIRKEKDLPFYPFDKKYDKYGSFHFSIFAQKIADDEIDDNNSSKSIKYIISDEILDSFMEELNANKYSNPNIEQEDFKITKMMIKKRMLYREGM